jgi:hypothetical protein
MQQQNTLALLVLSCDKYSDLWPGFFQCLRLHFPLERCKVYLGSNTLHCSDPLVTTILSGDDSDWSTSFRRILEQIPEERLFVVLEDLYLESSISPETLDGLNNFMIAVDAEYIRYWAIPRPPIRASQLAKPKPSQMGEPFRINVCGLWKKAALLGLLIDGENPWNFEINGSYRCSYSQGYYSMQFPIAKYRNMVEKGFWIPASLTWALSQNIEIDISARSRGGLSKLLLSQLSNIFFKLMLYVPWRYRVGIMDLLRRIFACY